MGDLKPIGSEKLSGDEKLKRILQLTYYNQKPITENTSSKKAELIKESANGVYGIVREKDGYYVKKGLNEGTLDYIGGLFMKNKNKFNSYAEALKRLELLKSQEINEDTTKYVLKQNKAAQEAPMPEPSMDAPAPAPVEEPVGELPPPAPEMGAETPAPGEPEMGDEQMPSSEEGKRSDYMAEIQKFAGKLGQELRDQQPKMESDDIKYVLNMIISAVDLDKLEDDDIDEIGKKFERDEEDAVAEPEMDMPTDDEPVADEEPAPAPEDDLAERIAKLEELVNTKIGDEPEMDLGEYNFEMDEAKGRSKKDNGQTDEELYNAMFDMGWDYGEYGSEDFDDNGFAEAAMNLGYRWNEKKKKWYNRDTEEEYSEGELPQLDITPELNEINESINTTLSKYFE